MIDICAQTNVDSLEYIFRFPPKNYLISIFDKQLNTYNLFNSIDYTLNGEKFQFRVQEDFSSSLIKAGDQSVREEHHFNFRSRYVLNEKIKLGLNAYNSIFADDQSLGINQASVSFFSINGETKITDDITISPFAGYSNNRQIGENDYGPLYGIEALTNRIVLSDFDIFSELRFKNEDILPRRNLIRYGNLLTMNRFNRDVFNFFNVIYSLSRKDFYFDSDSVTSAEFNIENNIQSRTETNYLLQDRLEYNNFLDLFSLEMLGRINFRSIDRDTRYKSTQIRSSSVFDTKIEELKIEFEGTTRYQTENFDGALRLLYSERDEKHKTKQFEGSEINFFEQRSELDARKNNNSTRASLSFLGTYEATEYDRITLSLFQSKLRYDTPSTFNDDDRDEILSIVRLRYSRLLNPFLEAFINLEGTYSHVVYLFAGRSSNNNINRILRLKSGGDYKGKNFSSYNSFEVSANYTVYDFEDISSGVQSFAFRQLTIIDSSSVRLTNRISLNIYSYLKYSEQGDFLWTSFSAKPTRFLEEIYAEPRLVLHLGNSILSSGVRFFRLDTYNYIQNEKEIDSEYRSIGPIVVINLRLFRSLNIILNGWYEFINTENSRTKEQSSMLLQLDWKF